jgi:DGQHR domain-containing protein
VAEALPRASDLGIQRRHDPVRSLEINEFVRYGFPWSALSEARRKSGRFEDLKKPGWLPTAIVINILAPNDTRRGKSVDREDVVSVSTRQGMATITLPKAFGPKWKPSDLPPFEIIDGQHRLGAFADTEAVSNFELPVVAFHGLDISWQAYLFYIINIKPTRINASLAYDMYPLLRTEDWLQRVEDHSVYRETRAQELTAALWSYRDSPWFQRINMLGESGVKFVTQSAWIRSLLATFVRPYYGPRIRIGGLFGAPVGSEALALPWSLAQQAGFLILAWEELRAAVQRTHGWADSLRSSTLGPVDSAFSGAHTLLNQDQGVRAVLFAFNDLSYVSDEDLELDAWETVGAGDATPSNIGESLITAKKQPFASFLRELAAEMAEFDWRAASAALVLGAIERAHTAAILSPNTQIEKVGVSMLAGLGQFTDVTPIHGDEVNRAIRAVASEQLQSRLEKGRELSLCHFSNGHREIAVSNRAFEADATHIAIDRDVVGRVDEDEICAACFQQRDVGVWFEGISAEDAVLAG